MILKSSVVNLLDLKLMLLLINQVRDAKIKVFGSLKHGTEEECSDWRKLAASLKVKINFIIFLRKEWYFDMMPFILLISFTIFQIIVKIIFLHILNSKVLKLGKGWVCLHSKIHSCYNFSWELLAFGCHKRVSCHDFCTLFQSPILCVLLLLLCSLNTQNTLHCLQRFWKVLFLRAMLKKKSVIMKRYVILQSYGWHVCGLMYSNKQGDKIVVAFMWINTNGIGNDPISFDIRIRRLDNMTYYCSNNPSNPNTSLPTLGYWRGSSWGFWSISRDYNL